MAAVVEATVGEAAKAVGSVPDLAAAESWAALVGRVEWVAVEVAMGLEVAVRADLSCTMREAPLCSGGHRAHARIDRTSVP